MPKVTKEYINKKREEIIDAAVNVFKVKPLYDLNMMDIIKEAGLSKGGIYRYFSDIDEIIVEIINRESSRYDYKNEIDCVIKESVSRADMIKGLLSVLGSHIEKNCSTLGKIQFELSILQADSKERAQKIMDNLSEYENGKYLIDSLSAVINEGIKDHEFNAGISEEEIKDYIRIYIEGLIKVSVMEKCYNINSGRCIDIERMISVLSHNLLTMLKGV